LSKVVYISDFFLNDIIGGGELNDDELILLLRQKGYEILKIKSGNVSSDFLRNNLDCFYIVSNFIFLKEKCKTMLQNKHNYIIYEHDHKYLKTRNPLNYENFKAPPEEIINTKFYSSAKAVFCQSSFHMKIIKKNLNLKNLVSVSGNLWSLNILDYIEGLSSCKKNDKISIMNSSVLHKNTTDAEFYCKYKKYDYEKISSSNYKLFLELLSKNKKFIFLPKTPETLSRIVVEAKMLNVEVITNKNIGACYEPWYSLNGAELIEEMRSCRNKIINLVSKTIEKKND
jgi:hypothetical protein